MDQVRLSNITERRVHYWDVVERALEHLPEQLQPQLAQLRDYIVLQAQVADLTELLTATADYPLLNLPLWMLDDLAPPDTTENEGIIGHVLASQVLTLLQFELLQLIQIEEPPFTREMLPLTRVLYRHSTIQLAEAFPIDEHFWYLHRAAWDEHEAAMADARRSRVDPDSRWLAPTRVGALAIVSLAREEWRLPQLVPLLNQISEVYWIIGQRAGTPFLHLRPETPRPQRVGLRAWMSDCEQTALSLELPSLARHFAAVREVLIASDGLGG